MGCCPFISRKKQTKHREINEKFYKDLLKKELYPDARQIRLKGGHTDLSDDTHHVEVKRWDSWKEALGQLLVYNHECPKESLAVYFYGNAKENLKTLAAEHLQRFGIRTYDIMWCGQEKIQIVNILLGAIAKTIRLQEN